MLQGKKIPSYAQRYSIPSLDALYWRVDSLDQTTRTVLSRLVTADRAWSSFLEFQLSMLSTPRPVPNVWSAVECESVMLDETPLGCPSMRGHCQIATERVAFNSLNQWMKCCTPHHNGLSLHANQHVVNCTHKCGNETSHTCLHLWGHVHAFTFNKGRHITKPCTACYTRATSNQKTSDGFVYSALTCRGATATKSNITR